MWFGFLRDLLEPLLNLRFGLGSQSLSEAVHGRIADRAAPLARHLRCGLVGRRGRDRKGQLLFQRRTQFLVCRQPPPLSYRITPMPIAAVLTINGLQFNDPDDRVQFHRFLMPMPNGLLAEGEKPRRGESLLLAAFSPTAAASIRGLPLTLPLQSPARNGSLLYPTLSSSCIHSDWASLNPTALNFARISILLGGGVGMHPGNRGKPFLHCLS